ncbi:MAG: arginase family protein [Planctomycetota bacterium]
MPSMSKASEGSAMKFHEHIRRDDPSGCEVAILGMPDDAGVALNGGRVGAARGPAGFRDALCHYGVCTPAAWQWPGVFDAGDTRTGSSLQETHRIVTEAAGELLDRDLLPVGIGGGHDLTFAFVRALCNRLAAPPVGVYFDAHLDVREGLGSGMPFRALAETCGVRELHAHGIDPFANNASHQAWFAAHGGRLDSFGPEDPWPEGDLFVSFDMDVIDQAYAPGVSAMNPCGMTPGMAKRWARSAGRCPRVRCFDIMELSPPLDPTGRTARLAAAVFLAFLRGVAERS